MISKEKPGNSTSQDGRLQNELAQIGVLGKVAYVFLHKGGVDQNGFARTVGGGEAHLIEHPLPVSYTHLTLPTIYSV